MSETNAPRSFTGSTAFAIENNVLHRQIQSLQSQLAAKDKEIERLKEESNRLHNVAVNSGYDMRKAQLELETYEEASMITIRKYEDELQAIRAQEPVGLFARYDKGLYRQVYEDGTNEGEETVWLYAPGDKLK